MDDEVHADHPLSRRRRPHPDQLEGTRDEGGDVFLVVNDRDAGTVGPQDRTKDLAITSDSDVIVAWPTVALAPLSGTLIQPASTATAVPLSYGSARSREKDSSTGAACPSAVKRQDLMPPAVPKGDDPADADSQEDGSEEGEDLRQTEREPPERRSRAKSGNVTGRSTSQREVRHRGHGER